MKRVLDVLPCGPGRAIDAAAVVVLIRHDSAAGVFLWGSERLGDCLARSRSGHRCRHLPRSTIVDRSCATPRAPRRIAWDDRRSTRAVAASARSSARSYSVSDRSDFDMKPDTLELQALGAGTR